MKKLEAIAFSFIGISLFLFIISLNIYNINGNAVQSSFNETNLGKSIISMFYSLFFIYGVFLFLLSSLEKKVQNEKKMISKVKEDPLLLDVARKIGKNLVIRRDLNHLMQELYKGNTNPGLGTKHVGEGINELRGRDGGRVYYRINSFADYEILGYSDKNTQKKVIERLKILYKH